MMPPYWYENRAHENAMQTGWLIEYGEKATAPPLYFAGFHPAPAGAESVICGNLCASWSYNDDCAVRFSRRQDAEKLLQILQVGGPHRLTEHGWG